MPYDEIKFFTQKGVFTTMYLKTQTNDSVLNMVLHLCDNDLDNSIFFINELLDSLFMHYEQEASEFEK